MRDSEEINIPGEWEKWQFLHTHENCHELEVEWGREMCQGWHYMPCLSDRQDQVVVYLEEKEYWIIRFGKRTLKHNFGFTRLKKH